MNVTVVNAKNEKVGAVELKDDVFGVPVNPHLIWESVVHQNAADRRGTHATKNRALVTGSGKKPWRQKGTGRARVSEIRNPLWRKGGTVFGPQPRSYDYALPRKVERAALRAAIAQRLHEGTLVIVDALSLDEAKTKSAAALLQRLGAHGKALVIDVQPDEAVARSFRNLADVRLIPSGRVTARDVMDTRHVVATRAALERLQEVLA